MNKPSDIRLDYLDASVARIVLSDLQERAMPNSLEGIKEKGNNLQTRYSFLASEYQRAALYLYALGSSFSQVKAAFSDAAKAYLKVFELRGAEPAFPAYTFTYNPAFPPDDPKSVVEFKPLHPEGTKDFSTTNSHKNYVAVCVALLGGEEAIAQQLAAMIWDPPDATYIGPRSFCTPNDQHLAYALRDLFRGDTNTALTELDKIGKGKSAFHRKSEAGMIRGQAAMIRALIGGRADQFLQGLGSVLEWHAKEAPKKENYHDPGFFVCLPALGLSKLTLRRGLFSVDRLPQDNQFLPLDLLMDEL